ncbi:MAG: hypothetical protein LBJ23_00780 [Tannerella sp.]|jgi:hypothetical protein|nr:hypothetical protein [Tannerella sp.]
MNTIKHRHTIGYLLVFLGYLLLQCALPSVGSDVKQADGQEARVSSDDGRKDALIPVNPFRPGMIRAAETSPFTYMFRIVNNLRSFLRIPARNIHQSFSFEKVTLLYSVHKKSLSRIFICKHTSNIFLCPRTSCQYYVFALREIII